MSFRILCSLWGLMFWLLGTASFAAPRQILIDHDGASDDFVAMALALPGNVSQDGRKPVAEWNVYHDPRALREVFAAKIPMLFAPNFFGKIKS